MYTCMYINARARAHTHTHTHTYNFSAVTNNAATTYIILNLRGKNWNFEIGELGIQYPEHAP